MSVMITADLHFSENPRDAYRFGFFDTMIELIQKYKVKQLLILGDITEAKDRHSSWLVNTITDEMEKLSGWCPITILRGNHDGIDTDLPFYKFLRHIKRIRWIIHPTQTEVPGLGYCLFLPHTTDYRLWADLPKKTGFEYIFAHNTFKGATGQHRELDGIPLDVFAKGARVIAGDVHVPHQVGPVTYVGSPYLIDFGDDFRPRVLLIKKDGSHKTVAFPGPQKRLIEVRAGEDVDKNATITGTGKLLEGDILKVRVTLPVDQYANWPSIKQEVLAWGKEHKYQIDQVVPVTEKSTKKKKKVQRVQRSAMSDDQILAAYAQSRGIDERTMKVGIKLLG